MSDNASISVVVPTRDRPHQLAACLAALAAQTLQPTEIIVVDDASRDSAAIDAIVGRVHGARIVRGRGAGPAAARNLGVGEARGDVLCLTDDDCRPHPAWTAALVETITAGATVVAGATEASPPSAIATRASQIITNQLVAASMGASTATVTFAPTCNLAFTAATAARFPFDESFPLAAGEDREWCDRVSDADIAIAYAPRAIVAHRPELTMRSFWRQQVRYGRGAAHWRRQRAHDPNWQPAGFYTDLVRAGFAGGVRCGLLVLAAQAATAYGLARETVAARQHRLG
ncbi:MAG: glycosyltransferase [Actinomycetota bacterium]